MGISTQRYALDTYLSEANPDRNYEWSQKMYLSNIPGDQKRSYIYFNRPFPLGATILRAELHLFSHAVDVAGKATIGMADFVERPYMSTVTWRTMGQTKPRPYHTEPTPVENTHEWVIDVTSTMQSVSDGADWFGWRLTLAVGSDMDEVTFYGVDGKAWRHEYRPMLYVEWSDAPDVPTWLVPGNGFVVRHSHPWLSWHYTDVSGNEEMRALQVQFDETADGFDDPMWDTCVYLSSMPELDLELAEGLPAPFPGIPDGGSLWWRVRVQDGAYLWSEWSDPSEIKRDSGGTFTLISPVPGGTVDDPSPLDDASPVISWSLTGDAQQQAYRVRVWLDPDRGRPLWSSDIVTSSATAMTIPPGVLRWDDRTYRFMVEVWDAYKRSTQPGASTAYREVTRAFLDWDGELEPIDTVAAWPLDPYPMVEIQWTRTTAPDGWTVVRDGEIIAELDYADTVLPDGSHRWIDRYAPPRRELRYDVRAKVNDRTAKSTVPAFVMSDPVGIWLVNDDDSVCIVGTDDGTWEMGETSAIYEPVTGERVVQVRSGLRGWEGSISGLLLGEVRGLEGISARYWRDAFLRIKRDGGARLTAQTVSIPVLTSDAVAAPTPDVEEQYAVEFSFWQQGYFGWDEL